MQPVIRRQPRGSVRRERKVKHALLPQPRPGQIGSDLPGLRIIRLAGHFIFRPGGPRVEQQADTGHKSAER